MSSFTASSVATTPLSPLPHRPHRGATPSRLDHPIEGIPFRRLEAVEFRKLVDTRAGRSMLVLMVAAMAIILAALVVAGAADDSKDWGDFMGGALFPAMLLLPVFGIMTVTSDWSQRTGLVTFTLEPRRIRVAWAKLAAAEVAGLALTAASFALGALATIVADVTRGTNPHWGLQAVILFGVIASQLVWVALGVAIGLMVRNTPAAIVTYLVVPNLLSVLSESVAWLERPLQWIDLNGAFEPFFEGTAHGADWGQLVTSSLFWVVVPFAVGLRILRRTEIK